MPSNQIIATHGACLSMKVKSFSQESSYLADDESSSSTSSKDTTDKPRRRRRMEDFPPWKRQQRKWTPPRSLSWCRGKVAIAETQHLRRSAIGLRPFSIEKWTKVLRKTIVSLMPIPNNANWSDCESSRFPPLTRPFFGFRQESAWGPLWDLPLAKELPDHRRDIFSATNLLMERCRSYAWSQLVVR